MAAKAPGAMAPAAARRAAVAAASATTKSQPSYQSGVVNAFSTSKRILSRRFRRRQSERRACPSTIPTTSALRPRGPRLHGRHQPCRSAVGRDGCRCRPGPRDFRPGSLDGKTQTLPALYKLRRPPAVSTTSPAATASARLRHAQYARDRLRSGHGHRQPGRQPAYSATGRIPRRCDGRGGFAKCRHATTTNLSVLGADSGGESTLTYTWAATTVPSGARRRPSASTAATRRQDTTATFSTAGTYVFTVTITDPGRTVHHQQRERDGEPDADEHRGQPGDRRASTRRRRSSSRPRATTSSARP